MNQTYFFYFLFYFFLFPCQTAEESDNNKLDYLTVKSIPSVIHNDTKSHSIRWHPLLYQIKNKFCLKKPEILRIINYPLVLTGDFYGKHVIFNPNFPWETATTQAKFSIVFWIYLEEYCIRESPIALCAILQHLTFNMTYLTPGLFLNRNGQLVVHMFEYLYDLKGDNARTLASIPKKDWCRVLFAVDEDIWHVSFNCLKTWKNTTTSTYKSANSYYYTEKMGTFVIGGSDETPSFRGFIGRMDIYRRVVLKPEQLTKQFHISLPLFLPKIISESNECLHHLSSFNQCREQVHLLNKRIQQKKTCNASPFRYTKSQQQCLLIRTWKEQSENIRYRICRALYRRVVNSTNDVAIKLFQLTINLLERDDPELSCKDVLIWSQQAVCYQHPAAHSLLATFYKFGLCGLVPNSTRALELLFNGALLKDRISLLALGHRHFYGLDGVPQDYDAAYVYYRQMADISKSEYYNPKPGEVIMEYVRLTNHKLIGQLTFDKSDTFYWLREQARRGVASAQQRLGSLMYTGSNGLTRNIQVAVEYFRLAADQHDASGLLMYGLALLKGQGITKNVTEGVRHLEKAAKSGYHDAEIALGYHAYNIEKNYTKAAQYWQTCYNQSQNMYCAHNLGVMWSAGHYPPDFTKDHTKAWNYYSYAAQKGEIDAKIVVAHYNALGDHPVIVRNSRLSAVWSRMVAQESSAVGLIVRRALKDYRDGRWQTSFIFYLQAALAGIELGYFNAGYLCYELKVNYNTTIDCIEQLFRMSLMIRDNQLQNENYDLLIIAEDDQRKKDNVNKSIELYIRLFDNGDPRGLFHLAQMSEINDLIPLDIWDRVGVKFDEKIITDKYRRIQAVYQYCQSLTIPRRDESYIPCTLAYLKISTIIFLDEHSKILLTTILLIVSLSLSFSLM